jgi:hypothetical protein
MNRIILILVLILAILVVGSILLISLLRPQKTPLPPPPPVIQASIPPIPSQRPISTTPSAKTLFLVSASPLEDTNQTYFPIKQIFFTFSEPMNPTTFFIETSPDTKAVITLKPDDPKTVVVSPQDIWPDGITAITILATTTSQNGTKLSQPVSYKINTKFPDNPPPDSPGL